MPRDAAVPELRQGRHSGNDPATRMSHEHLVETFGGRYRVRIAANSGDLDTVLALRKACFGGAAGRADAHDATAIQVFVEAADNNALVCSYRLRLLEGGELHRSYAAQFYDLRRLSAHEGVMMELGRFCIDRNYRDPDILRLAWCAITALVDARNVKMLFGCSSFAGVDPRPYHDAFGMLRARHLAPPAWRPGIGAAEVFAFADIPRDRPDPRAAALQMPPPLRSYLLMGGRVSDHAVVDRALQTLHVFTALEVAAIPEGRKRSLRALVQQI
ncbi:GNAT family N-acetyltransferase [Sulfitobacter aestuarii]|uniref:L-ornithine N(alpha)-acyltransferase n=1 Tax=Sulfitobacter aestuarii TaxID=2161676 RepID=A0ABW5U1W9_9RHOB